MNLNPVVLSIPIYFLLIGIELIVERFSKKKEYRLHDALTNISCGITQQISGIFLKILGIASYQLVYEHLRITEIPVTWWSLTLLFIGADFFYYWAHRMSHEINLFWGGHVVHHQSEDYNLSVALRQGSFQILWTFAFSLPLAVFGFDTLSFAMMSGFVTIYQFWIHTEYIGKMGWFEKIFNTPSHHRVHHGRDPKYIDKNHAGVFIIWDKMFGTFQQEEEKPTYGITTPINSWNPVWVNFSHYVNIARQLKDTPSFSDKLRVLFNKPGWVAGQGLMPIPEVNKATYKKYDTKAPTRLNYYALIQYTVLLVSTALFLFNHTTFSLSEKAAVASLLILGVVNIGVMFERRSWSFFSEIIRLVLMSLIIVYFGQGLEEFTYLIVGSGIFTLISISLLMQFRTYLFHVIPVTEKVKVN